MIERNDYICSRGPFSLSLLTCEFSSSLLRSFNLFELRLFSLQTLLLQLRILSFQASSRGRSGIGPIIALSRGGVDNCGLPGDLCASRAVTRFLASLSPKKKNKASERDYNQTRSEHKRRAIWRWLLHVIRGQKAGRIIFQQRKKFIDCLPLPFPGGLAAMVATQATCMEQLTDLLTCEGSMISIG